MQDMETKYAVRLTVVERNQFETTKRLEAMMNSNQNIQSMLETVLTTLSNKNNNVGTVTKQQTKLALGESSGQGPSTNDRKENESAPKDKNEQWWDELCRNSEDELRKVETVANDRLHQPLPSQEEVITAAFKCVTINTFVLYAFQITIYINPGRFVEYVRMTLFK